MPEVECSTSGGLRPPYPGDFGLYSTLGLQAELPDSFPGAASLLLPTFAHLPAGSTPRDPALWSVAAS